LSREAVKRKAADSDWRGGRESCLKKGSGNDKGENYLKILQNMTFMEIDVYFHNH
jgi:hypothetical protein